MIKGIEVSRFKCFDRLSIQKCRRINVMVGDNGAGKTALLEAIFLALGSSSELVVRFNTQRSGETQLRGSARRVGGALINDYFFNSDPTKPISIRLLGSGEEARSVDIVPAASESLLTDDGEGSLAPARFIWTDALNKQRVVVPTLTPQGLRFPETGEDLPDFFFFAANQTYSAIENAERFSDLRRAKRHTDFNNLFTTEYPWIEDLAIDVVAGAPAIHASVKGKESTLAISNISGGINKVMSILLSIASRQRSVVLVDEIENGLYYTHHKKYWEILLAFARNYEGQIFLTTHSREWLAALIEAAGDNVDDIALWRLEREENGGRELFQFEGRDLKAAMEFGGEPRGSAS
jgi:hypothetical protein